ncbi:MAG: hypothetical protein CDV28_12013 [Candidatus Electronema aureum]|uniref:Uncharacterized protein n=1 Tax=Candidatus Electronema aureum TaxID=2005002 RepID=A0A521G101_9BACT|nr:MAG: hypothetical protein CDV28_12013 [Candidatus Electronema aureum]
MTHYDKSALRLLNERTEYEAWFLEAVYNIAEFIETPWFRKIPDVFICPVDSSEVNFVNYCEVNFVIGGGIPWQAGFLTAGAPLVFITTFKLLDMLIEWILEQNGCKKTFRFEEKIKSLKSSPSPTFPHIIESRPWLKERLICLYKILEPFRGTIIHDRHFTSNDGVLRVSSRVKGGCVNHPFEISRVELSKLAFTIVSVLNYVNRIWSLDDQYHERTLRHNLDCLTRLHGLSSLGQRQPICQTVRAYSTNPDPTVIKPTLAAILSAIKNHHPDNDCMFDLRVLTVGEGKVVDAFLFPWKLFENKDDRWGSNVKINDYRIQIPSDVDPKHLEGSRASNSSSYP